MTERVTLILGEERIEVPRQDLISQSLYFAALFSHNFKDSQSSEHQVNYNIHIDTLQTFVAWVSDHKAIIVDSGHCVKPSLAKYVTDSENFDVLVELLRLSILFAADDLVEDLSELIATHWLIPQKSLQIWLLAKELGLTTLRDLAKATCVDYVCDIPETLLLELPENNFIELIGNVFVRVNRTFPCKILKQWVDRHLTPSESDTFKALYPFTKMLQFKAQYSFDEKISLEKAYEDQYWRHNIQCIVGHKETSDDRVTKCVFGWDGTTFSEILDLSSCPIWASNITRLQVVGQGFDIYIVGGEYGEETGNFQTEIWCYSLISKTWHYVTRMPEPRVNMMVKFVNTKLLLIGGEGLGDFSLLSIDIYDIHTGTWSKGCNATESFSNDTLVAVSREDGVLTFYDPDSTEIHTYNVQTNSWAVSGDFNFYNDRPYYDHDLLKRYRKEQEEDPQRASEDDSEDEYQSNREREMTQFHKLRKRMEPEYIEPKFLMVFRNTNYLLGSYSDMNTLKMFKCKDFMTGRSIFCQNWGRMLYDNQINDGPGTVGFTLAKGADVYVEVVQFTQSSEVYKVEMPDIIDLCPDDPVGCFTVHNPQSLNELVVFHGYTLEKKKKNNETISLLRKT